MPSVAVTLLFVCTWATVSAKDVDKLEGESDFNSIRLHWTYQPLDEEQFNAFKITHCEDQAWGPFRCRNIVLERSKLSEKPLNDGQVEFSGQVSHLRMATNYTLQVRPLLINQEEEEDLSQQGNSGRAISGYGRSIPEAPPSAQVFIQTKGFSAKAVSCLTNSTLVEVETGPYFGGKISVEGSMNPLCATQGNLKSSNTKYRLDIDHTLCGSDILADSVRTYVLVQENLPILTHSTRRFLVVCRYLPEAFTVSAGVSLPGQREPDEIVPVDQTVNEVDPSELFDSTNSLASRRGNNRAGKALQLQQETADGDEEIPGGAGLVSQLVLMLVLIVAAVVGLSCAFWHFGRHAALVSKAVPESLAEEGLQSSAGTDPAESDENSAESSQQLTENDDSDDIMNDDVTEDDSSYVTKNSDKVEEASVTLYENGAENSTSDAFDSNTVQGDAFVTHNWEKFDETDEVLL